jgi:hypothetical protein
LPGVQGTRWDQINLFAQMKAYSIGLLDGDELLLEMDFLDPLNHEWIGLYSPDGVLLQTETTGSFEEAILSWTATQAGTFYIVLSELEGDDTGEYVFTLAINGSLIGISSPMPEITSSNLSICPGESTTLDAGSWSSYDWNTGETTQIIQVNTPGTFSVTVSNNFGCSGEDEITISQTDSLACDTTIICPDTLATPTVVNDTVCAGEPAVLTAFGSTGVYRWYDAPVGGNLLFDGNSFLTPPLFNTTTYYVEAYTDSLEVPGEEGIARALLFQEGGDHVDCGNPPDSLFDFLEDGTIEAWVKPQEYFTFLWLFGRKGSFGKR